MEQLERVGYGSSFNSLFTDGILIQKKAKNEYGKNKIEYEKKFFLYVKEKNLFFPLPEIVSYDDFGYTMKYYKGWLSFLEFYKKNNLQRQKILLEKVYNCLETLHLSEQIRMSKEIVTRDLQYELSEKLLERWLKTEDIIKSYDFITHVNNVPIETFDTLLHFFRESFQKYLKYQSMFFYCPIHGDCQFNNILINEKDDALLFIDPRGYFGKTTILGLPEYDIAKVRFALSGYDNFDNMKVESLEINGTNITLPDICLVTAVLAKSDFTAVLMASIWVGNPHSFKDTPLKAVCSSFYARYYATLIYRNVKSLIK